MKLQIHHAQGDQVIINVLDPNAHFTYSHDNTNGSTWLLVDDNGVWYVDGSIKFDNFTGSFASHDITVCY